MTGERRVVRPPMESRARGSGTRLLKACELTRCHQWRRKANELMDVVSTPRIKTTQTRSATFSARLKSSIKSSASSNPIDSRIVPWVMPPAASASSLMRKCVVLAG